MTVPQGGSGEAPPRHLQTVQRFYSRDGKLRQDWKDGRFRQSRVDNVPDSRLDAPPWWSV